MTQREEKFKLQRESYTKEKVKETKINPRDEIKRKIPRKDKAKH